MKKNYIVKGMPEVLTHLISGMLVNDLGADQMSENEGLGDMQCYFLRDWALTLKTGAFVNTISIFGDDLTGIERRRSELENHVKQKHGVYLGLEEK